VDPDSPPWRAAYILANCGVRVLIVEARLEAQLRDAFREQGQELPPLLVLEGVGGGEALRAAVTDPGSANAPALPEGDADDVAYILYTSGSTGKPKGVTLTHRNALSFVQWCVDTFDISRNDRFSSHAPLHFDLSVFDLYVPARLAATVTLIGSAAGREPAGLAALMAERRLTVWYSTPSILSMLAQYGKMQRHSWDALRIVLFAGEVFPIKHLRAVKAVLSQADFFNLYGPTETNVCTWYRVPAEVEPERVDPYPIGRVCTHLRGRVIDPDTGEDVSGEGELCIAGPAVMAGYWDLPEQSAGAFLIDQAGTRWYRTGDIVAADASGDFVFLGRRDRMVKRRGYRIELGEIEAALYRHPDVHEAAAVAQSAADGTVITAYLHCRSGAVPTLIEMKRYCAGAMPASMIPDRFVFQDALPKTSTDKIDYQRLVAHT
jgi:amino acid adenylation domain-containing protein